MFIPISAIVAILAWQLLTFVVFAMTRENEDILVLLSCGAWILVWNTGIRIAEKIFDKNLKTH